MAEERQVGPSQQLGEVEATERGFAEDRPPADMTTLGSFKILSGELSNKAHNREKEELKKRATTRCVSAAYQKTLVPNKGCTVVGWHRERQNSERLKPVLVSFAV